jgi:hypothetical protein
VVKTDLHLAPDIEDYKDDVFKLLDGLLSMNDPFVIGNLLGWFSACFFRRFHHETYNQFPLLMAYGEAGAGKSTTLELLSHLFYFNNKPLILQTASTTMHALQGALISSASVPVILDEYKPREMPPGLHDKLRNQLRGTYNSGELAKGGLADDPTNWKEIGRLSCSAPILIIGEAVETQTATLERTVTVAFKRRNSDARRAALEQVQDHKDALPILGRALMMSALCMTVPLFKAEMVKNLSHVRQTVRQMTQKDRVIYNTTAVYHGLNHLWNGVTHWLDEEQVEALREACKFEVVTV